MDLFTLMSQLTIKLSDKADALIAQLQKEIFNRRRKKVSPAGVVETLVESGAKSQSDKRFATSWKNLVSDIEKAAKEANAHGVKPAGISDTEWALILSHRSRSASRSTVKAAGPATAKAKTARKAPAAKTATSAKATAAKPAAAKTTSTKRSATSSAGRKPSAGKSKTSQVSEPAGAPGPSSRRRASAGGSSVARRMAKAVSRLSASGLSAGNTAPTANGSGTPALV
jgi:hypothetical protein